MTVESPPDLHRCLAGPKDCRNPDTSSGKRQPAQTDQPVSVCPACWHHVNRAISELPGLWAQLHAAIGEKTPVIGPKVRGTPAPPAPINCDVDALMGEITEWLVAAARRVAAQLNTTDPAPRNNTPAEQRTAVARCTRLITAHRRLDALIALPAQAETLWLTPSETERAGESLPDGTGWRTNTAVRALSGWQLVKRLCDLHARARTLLRLTEPVDTADVPCPNCNEKQLVRHNPNTPRDQVICRGCKLDWPYERYRQLCHWIGEEEKMRSDQLQKQLDEKTRQLDATKHALTQAHAQLAEKERLISAAVDCIPALKDILTITVHDTNELLTERDLAHLVGVAPSTVRSWAARKQITQHIGADGSPRYLAADGWKLAKRNGSA